MKLTIPELSLVVFVGASGSGKSTFAKKYFQSTEILSSDFCRSLVCDDENNQAATNDAFDVLHYIASKRLSAGKLTVIDATNVQPEDRRQLIAIARQYHLNIYIISEIQSLPTVFVYLLSKGENYQVNTYGGTDIFRIRQVDFGSLNLKLEDKITTIDST
jgi:tRNA uridine 5-carbamoylmethylation protein Kti12